MASINLDEGAGSTVGDVSGHGDNGTVTNTTWTASVAYGSALNFNGSNTLAAVNASTPPADTTAPTITSRRPAAGKLGAAVDAKIAATFSEAVRPGTIVFVLKNGAGATIASTTTYDATGQVATLTPKSALAYSTTYTATLSGASDGAGNVMKPTSWSFTTAPAAPDVTAPTVTSRRAAPGSIGAAVDAKIAATFSEMVRPGTIGFVLKDGAGTTIAATKSYDEASRVVTLTPKSALAYSTTYTATLSGARDGAGNLMEATSWSFTTAAAPVGTPRSTSGSKMVLDNYNNSTSVPLNKAGDQYPDIYMGEGSAGTVSINTSDSITGNSLQVKVSKDGLYLQWNPYSNSGRGFAKEYTVDPSAWESNTYDHMSFWIKRPTTSSPLITNGSHGTYVGTYVKRVANADPLSDETSGSHYYHSINLPNDGQWTQVILNMHPDHRRGDPGDADPGFLPYPTTASGPSGAGDPASTYNYFDALTRFYIDDTRTPTTGTYLIDDIQFYNAPYLQNDVQVSSLTGTYDPRNNEVIVTWNRPQNENTVNHEVRYSFSDINKNGWDSATAAPNGIVTPPGWEGYNGMYYDSKALPTSGHSVLYIAIKPQNSPLFSQIAIPLTGVGGSHA